MPVDAGHAAQEYQAHGWVLCPIHEGEKGPRKRGWYLREKCIIGPGWINNIGVVHGHSGTCAIDIDHLEKARLVAFRHGVFLDSILDAPDAVGTDTGRPGHAKRFYRLPFPIPSFAYKEDGEAVIDFRCVAKDGAPSKQDVLPPSKHPNGSLYRWVGGGDWRHLPPLPPELLRLWQELAAPEQKKRPQRARQASEANIPLSDRDLEQAWSALQALDPDMAREDWVRTGMAAKAAGLDWAQWDEWSSGGLKYEGVGDTEAVWASIDEGGGIGPGTLFHLAIEAGWRPPRPTPEEMFGGEVPPAPPLPAAGSRGVETRSAELDCRVHDFEVPTLVRWFRDNLFPPVDGVQSLIHHGGVWYSWVRSRWIEVDEVRIRRTLGEYLPMLYREVHDEEGSKRDFLPFKSGRSVVAINSVLDYLQLTAWVDKNHVEPFWLDGRAEDTHHWLVFENGRLSLSTGVFEPTTAALFTTAVIGTAWEPEARCPRWERFITEMFTHAEEGLDAEQVVLFQQMMGYLIAPDTRLQKAFVLLGPARCGKGTIARMLRRLLGGMYSAKRLHDFGERFGMEDVVGKRLIVISDSRSSNRTDLDAAAERILNITGEDAISVDRRYKGSITAQVTAKILVISNLLPHMADPSGVLSRRFHYLRALQSFEENPDLDLFDKLVVELPGIARWCVEGYHQINNRFRETQTSMRLRNRMRMQMDPIQVWAEESLEKDTSSFIPSAELHMHYQEWCDSRDIIPLDIRNFGKALNARLDGINYHAVPCRESTDRGQVRGIRGVRLRTPVKNLPKADVIPFPPKIGK